MTFALDTNAVIHFFKGKGNVAARLLATPPGEIALPAVVVFEPEISTRLESTGSAIGPLDLLIAATALAHNATLVTHNTDEFSRVPGLALEDWFA